jgi:hypothetical protein
MTMHPAGDGVIMLVQSNDSLPWLARIDAGGIRWSAPVSALQVQDISFTSSEIVLLTRRFEGATDDCSVGDCLWRFDTNTGALVSKAGLPSESFSSALAVDAAGNLFLWLYSFQAVELGGEALPLGQSLVSLDASGLRRFALRVSGRSSEAQLTVHAPSGDLWVTGDSTEIDFGGGPLTWHVDHNYVAHLDNDGRLISARAYRGYCYDACDFDFELDPAGNAYLGGTARGSSPELGADKYFTGAFVTKLAPDLSHVWTRSFAFNHSDGGSFAVGSHGHAIVEHMRRYPNDGPMPDPTPTPPLAGDIVCVTPDGKVGDTLTYLERSSALVRRAVAVNADERAFVAIAAPDAVDLGSGSVSGPLVVGALDLATETESMDW